MFTGLRTAARRLSKSPVFTITALATLALCIGANLTIFAVNDAILIRSLPFPHADRLVTMYYVYPKLPSATPGASVTNYYERRGKIAAFSSIAAIDENTTVLGETGSTSITKVGRVTPEFFSTLGVPLLLGRPFTDADMTYQTDHIAILSNEYWRTAYNADPNVLGRTVRMDGDLKRIVGVLPPHFRFLSFQAPVYMPLSTDEGDRNVAARHSIGKTLIGRIAAGSTLKEAQAQVDALDAELAPLFPEAKVVADAGTHTIVAPLQADYVASVRPMLVLLQVAALFLLLIGCVNLVNLLLIRASNRSRDLAIRQALGAGRRHIFGDVLSETTLLAFGGAILGIWLGAIGIRWLGLLGVDRLPLGAEVAFNGNLALVAFGVALAAGFGVALPIAWFNLHGEPTSALKSASRGGTSGAASLRLRRGFITAQIAMAFVLLAGASLLGMSLRNAMAVAPGFRPDHVITGQFNLTWHGYPSLESFHKFFGRLSDEAGSIPGITAVGATTSIPVVGAAGGDVMSVRGYAVPEGQPTFVVHDVIGVAGDYFTAMGIPLISGRLLRPSDATSQQWTCVVDEAFARHYWPGGSALGHEITPGTNPGPGQKYYTIVGVVGTVKQAGLTEKAGRGAAYLPYSRQYFRQYYLVARTVLEPDAVVNSLVKAVRLTDADVALTNLRTMDTQISESLSTRRSPALMATVFAASALLLATVGLYGVMAYAVAQRTREFGVRVALGARSQDVLMLVLGEGLRLVAIGLAVGAVLSLVLTRAMASQLYGVRWNDPVTLLCVITGIGIVAGLACILPARRATKVDPMVALRSE
ncbi:MAG TPA: ABC transporter permease [Opitutaceae bacterium]|jgi:predicted permease